MILQVSFDFSGGRTFARKERDFTIRIQEKVVEFGLRSALSSKYSQGQLHIMKDLSVDFDNDLELKKLFDRTKYNEHGAKTLVVYDNKREDNVDRLLKAAQDLKWIRLQSTSELAVYDLLKHDQVFLSKSAVLGLERRLHRE